MARMTLEQIKRSRPRADRAKIEATSEEDIARHMREDGENPDAGLGTFIEDVPPTEGDKYERRSDHSLALG